MVVAGVEKRTRWAFRLVPVVMLVVASGCFHAAPGVKQSMTAAAPAAPAPKQVAHSSGTEHFDLDAPPVEEHVAQFQGRRRNFFKRAIERAGKYLPSMTHMLKREGLPTELAYLPLIESGYREHAVSPAGATGPWQFIKGTGKRYGLRIDSLVDERRDPIKSTEAAAQYLKDLHGMFGDWQLALAGYNTGEYRVAKIMEHREVEDFWEMRERGYLPRETSEYVPSFLAAVRIAQAPEHYGFYDLAEADPLTLGNFETVEVDRQVSLHAAAGMCGVSTEELAELNPALRRGITPTGYSLRVPPGKADPLRTQLASYVEPVQPARARRSIARRSRDGGARETRVAQTDRRPSRQVKRGGAARTQMARAQGPKSTRKLEVAAKPRGTGKVARKGSLQRTASRSEAPRSCGGECKATRPLPTKWKRVERAPQRTAKKVAPAKAPAKKPAKASKRSRGKS